MENEVKSSNSQWWNAHIDANNTEWLAQNLKDVDHRVKQILLLVEQDGDTSSEDVNIHHLGKPGLIAHIKEISDMYQSLADRYSNLTGELRSCIQSQTGMQNFEGALSEMQTPSMKQGMAVVKGQLASIHSPLSSSNASSDASSNAYSGPSSLSSDSDSDTYYLSPNDYLSTPSYGKMLKHKPMPTEPVVMDRVDALTKNGDADDMMSIKEREDYDIVLSRIAEYQVKLEASNHKLQLAEEAIGKLKSKQQEDEVVILKMASLEAQLSSAENHIKSYEAHLDMENKRSLLLQSDIVELEAKVKSDERQILDLQESVRNYREELSVRDLEIQKLSAELQDASGNFALEKWELEACVSKLTDRLTFHVAKNEELQIEFESLTDELKKCEAGAVQMEMKWQKDVDTVREEVHRKNGLIDTLNQNLDELKQNHDMILAEKDDVKAKLQTVSAELGVRNDQIQQIHSENKQLSTLCENVKNQKDKLNLRIGELEKELGQHTVAISEIAEEKREAIRQLCFSLNHFKGAYEEIRTTYVAQKRPTTVLRRG